MYDGLFDGRNVNVTLEDVWLSDCKLSAASNVSGLIQTETCSSAPRAYWIELIRVQFMENRNAGGSAGLHVEDPSCSGTFMNGVAFLNNTFLNGSARSSHNILRNLRLIGNRPLYASGENLFVLYFPPQSKTQIISLFASDNYYCLAVDEGELDVRHATFTRMADDVNFLVYAQPASIIAKKANVTIHSSGFNVNSRAIRLREECNFVAVSCVFSRNGLWSYTGSAISAYRPQSMHLVSTVFEENKLDFYASYNVGTVFIDGSSRAVNSALINVSHCHFRDNIAFKGGGFSITDYHRGRVLVDSTTFSGNGLKYGGDWHDYDAGEGGVFFVENCRNISFRIQKSTFDSNQAVSFVGGDGGGAIYFLNNTGELFIRSSLFRNNVATDDGGAISVAQPEDTVLKVNVSDCSFEGNRCFFLTGGARSFGGSIAVQGKGVELDIKRTVFRDSSADNGGSVCAERTRLLRIERCTFHSNRATHSGGALLTIDTEPPELRRSRLINNTAEHGGAIYSRSDRISMYNCVFAKNQASGNGGALAAVIASAVIRCRRCRFISNSAKKNGGAIHVFPVNSLSLNDVVFAKNEASFWGGAVSILLTEVFHSWSFASISQCHFVENQAALGGDPVLSRFIESQSFASGAVHVAVDSPINEVESRLAVAQRRRRSE